MRYRVGVEHKMVTFTGGLRGRPEGVPLIRVRSAIRRAKVLKILENAQGVWVVCDDPAVVFKAFRSEFIKVDAAGGVARNEDGEVLMILRNGRWDLPKGHREKGESLAGCAAREVEEECGVSVTRVGSRIATTRHIYKLHGRWAMKKSTWYAMEAAGEPAPQTEEGISRAEWTAPDEAAERAAESFATIKEVMTKEIKQYEKINDDTRGGLSGSLRG